MLFTIILHLLWFYPITFAAAMIHFPTVMIKDTLQTCFKTFKKNSAWNNKLCLIMFLHKKSYIS